MKIIYGPTFRETYITIRDIPHFQFPDDSKTIPFRNNKYELSYITKLNSNFCYYSDQYGNIINFSIIQNDKKSYNSNEWGCIIGNDVYILHHRCGSSSLRKMLLYKKNIISKDDVYCPDVTKNCWGIPWNSLNDLRSIRHKQNYTFHMIVHKDIITSALKKLPLDITPTKQNLYKLLLMMRCHNINPMHNGKSDLHFISQVSHLHNIGIPKSNLKLYFIDDLNILAKNQFGLDEAPKVHLSTRRKRKRLTIDDLEQHHIDMINDIYKCDNVLYGPEYKNNYVRNIC